MNVKKSKNSSIITKPYCLRSSNMNHFEKTLLNVVLNLDKDAFLQNQITPCLPESTRFKRIYRHVKQSSRQKSISSEVTRHSLCSKHSFHRKGRAIHKSRIPKKAEQEITFIDECTNSLFKFSQFKEDELNLSNIKEQPQITWMKVDNDVMSDDNDIENGKNILFEELEKTISKISNDSKYLRMNIKRMRMKKKGKYSLE